ncbi:MAG: outer membrane protein OmpK [Elusimicrobiaceae bacterium]|nr:outer membrane protein OmpK [Elusimicrobiaceae bacterium]
MKKTRFAVLAALAGSLAAGLNAGARAEDYAADVRKNDGKWLSLNLYQADNVANSFGSAYNMLYFEIEGGARSGILDLYYFYDVNEIFGLGTYSSNAGQFFTKIKPRLSIDGITRRDLSVGPVKEWYLATQYKGFNDGEYYSAGVGTDWKIPGVEMLSINFWPKFVRFSGTDRMSYAGLELCFVWYKTICSLPWGSTLTYQGWLDYGFSNSYARSNGNNATSDEFQMFNGFCFNKGRYSASVNIKFHRHFSYMNAQNSDETSWFFGLHYRP